MRDAPSGAGTHGTQTGTQQLQAVEVLRLAALGDPHALARAVELAAAVARGPQQPGEQRATADSPTLTLLRGGRR